MEGIFNDDGSFTDEGRASLVSAAGEGHEETKVFDDTKDLATLAKNYAHTKAAMGKKMENVIQKPAADASDEDRATFNKSLLVEAGYAAPETKDGYNFERADLPPGLMHNDAMESSFKEFFHAENVPASVAEKTFQHFQNLQVESHKAMIAEQTETMTKEWPGDKLNINNRMALRAVEHFIADDDLKAKMKEAKLYDNPADHEAWMKVGITPAQRMMWAKIGAVAMKAEAFKDEKGGPTPPTKGGQVGLNRAEAMRLYPATPDLWPAE